MTAFCIDFAIDGKIVPEGKLEVLEYDEQDLAEEMQEFGATTPEQLTDWDRCVFSTEEAAEKFLNEYLHISDLLRTHSFCLDRKFKALAYRKRNLIQSLMGAKMQTHREYYRAFEPGQLINLHDRTNFLTVRIIAVTQDGDKFKYAFELPEEIQRMKLNLGVGLE